MVSPIYMLKAISFLDLLAVGLIVPLVSSHVRDLGGNHIHVGLLGSIYAGLQLGSGPLIGSLSDIKGRKSILIITLLICGVAYTVKGFTSSIYVFLIIRAILGLFKQTQMLTRAMVPDYERSVHKQSEIYGKINAISGAGIALGPVIGGHVVEDYPVKGFTLIAIMVGTCYLINAVLVSLLPDLTIRPKRKKAKSTMSPRTIVHIFISSLKQSWLELYNINWSHYWDVFLFKGLVGFAMGVYYSSYASHLKYQYNLTPKYIGYIISLQGTVGSFSSYFIGFINSFYIHDKDYSQRIFHVFIMLTVALFGLILSYNIFLYVLCLIPLAIGNAMGRLITLEMVLNRSRGDHRGTLIGASNSVRSLSAVVSPMVAGLIGEFMGVTYAIYASFLSTALGVLLSYQVKNKRLKVD